MTKRRTRRSLLGFLDKVRERRHKQGGEPARKLLLERLDARILLDASGFNNNGSTGGLISPDGLWQLVDLSLIHISEPTRPY